MLDSTVSWILAGLSYDEDHIIDYVPKLLGEGYHSDFQGTGDGSHFYGIVTRKKTGEAWLVNRGTDGYDKLGNLKSWLYDTNIFAGDDGVHNGFQALGNRAFDDLKHYLWDCDKVYCTGHSQGAGVSPYQACLCVENITTLKHVHFDIFGAPPAGNDIFSKRVQNHIDNGMLSGNRFVNDDDPISSPILRQKDSILLNGVDVGSEIKLPKGVPYKLAKPVNHSCRIYNLLLMMHYAGIGYHHFDDYELLANAHKLLVN